MNTTLAGREIRPTGGPPPNTIEKLRIRPVDGGLNLAVTGELIDPKQATAMRDVWFFKNEMRKAHGSSQLGSDLDFAVMHAGLWERLDGILMPIAITTRDLYYYASAQWNRVSPAANLTGTEIHPVHVKSFEDKLYWTSYDYELRMWDGNPANSHALVAGGFAAAAMDVINNRLVLGHTIEAGVARSQTIRWTQNGSIVFTGPGSGSRDFADRPGRILNITKLGPYRGVVYETESINEIRATGDSEFVFDSTEIKGGLGLLLMNSVAECSMGHYFVGNDEQIYLYDGSGFSEIGSEIRDEFFKNLNYSSMERAVGWYNKPTKEYIIAIPTGTTPNTVASLYYAFDTLKKRWRSGIYTGVTSASDYRTIVGITWDEDVGTWDEATDTWNDEEGVASRNKTMVGMNTKRVLILDDTKYLFDGSPLEFSWTSGDIVGKQDGDEITTVEIIIGYIVDGTATLTVELSADLGRTFSVSKTASLGGGSLSSGDVAYVHVPITLTADNIRMRLSNALNGQVIRIVSLAPRISFSMSSRAEATK